MPDQLQHRPDVDELVREYAAVADQVDRLTAELGAARSERNAVLAALSEAGLTQQQILHRTGLTVAVLRNGLHNAYMESRR